MACSVREMAERFNASVTVLNAFNPLPEYFQGPSIDDRCNSKEEPSLPYSPALLELRDLQKEAARNILSRTISLAYAIQQGSMTAILRWSSNGWQSVRRRI